MNGNNTVFTVTGTAVQNATAGFAGNGFQGPGGSAYVLVNTSTPFTSVIASSSTVSFEFGGVVASPVPEPSSFWCLFGLSIGIVALRRRISFSQAVRPSRLTSPGQSPSCYCPCPTTV